MENIWPLLRFYQNLHDDLLDIGDAFHIIFPVLAGLVVRSADNCWCTVVNNQETSEPLRSMRFLWLTEQRNKVDWKGLTHLFPRMKVVGVTAHPIRRNSEVEDAHPHVASGRWPQLHAFHSNVASVAAFAKACFPAATVVDLSDTRSEGLREINDDREIQTRHFLLANRLSTWSSACSNDLLSEVENPSDSAYAEEDEDDHDDEDEEEAAWYWENISRSREEDEAEEDE
jgi:hypothetical protein